MFGYHNVFLFGPKKKETYKLAKVSFGNSITPLPTAMAVAPYQEDVEVQDSCGPIELTGLAEQWEADPVIRQSARKNGQLVTWLKPEATGIVSQNLISK